MTVETTSSGTTFLQGNSDCTTLSFTKAERRAFHAGVCARESDYPGMTFTLSQRLAILGNLLNLALDRQMELSIEKQVELRAVAKRADVSATVATRARIVLWCTEGRLKSRSQRLWEHHV